MARSRSLKFYVISSTIYLLKVFFPPARIHVRKHSQLSHTRCTSDGLDTRATDKNSLSQAHKYLICYFQHPINNMTIKVEREALLRILTREPSGPSFPCEKTIQGEGEYVVVDIPKPFMGEDFYGDSLRGPTSDDESTCTLSTSSLSTESTDSIERRVSFSETLVSDQWTRPFTPRDEVSTLFYSTEETLRYVVLV